MMVPCPRCGYEPTITTYDVEIEGKDGHPETQTRFRAMCSNAGVGVGPGIASISIEELKDKCPSSLPAIALTYEGALERWNARHSEGERTYKDVPEGRLSRRLDNAMDDREASNIGCEMISLARASSDEASENMRSIGERYRAIAAGFRGEDAPGLPVAGSGPSVGRHAEGTTSTWSPSSRARGGCGPMSTKTGALRSTVKTEPYTEWDPFHEPFKRGGR